MVVYLLMVLLSTHQFVCGLTTITSEDLKTISLYKIVVVRVGQHCPYFIY